MTSELIEYPFHDPAVEIGRRVEDLLSRMTLEDKAGVMFHTMASFGDFKAPGLFNTPSMQSMLEKRMNHFNILSAPSAREIAAWHNALQREALKHPLGIPVTLSTDPRHSFTDNPATAMFAGPFSHWPEAMGFAAIGDVSLMARFSEIVRREYLAVGIRTALHPQVDLASEPRWARASGTFGADERLSAELGAAQIRALRGDEFGAESVSAMVKHFPGGGPQKDGEDPHFAYGREQTYTGGQFELHLEPFKAAIAAGVRQIMPYYGIPVGLVYNGQPVEEVAFGFNKQMLTDLLRGELGYEGIICTDWRILGERGWGVEDLSYEERMIKSLDAGVDQFGGESDTNVLVSLLKRGIVAESRIDDSVRRLLRQKFELGLFEQRFVDEEAAEAIVGSAGSNELGLQAQAAAFTLLKNDPGPAALPLEPGARVYYEGSDPAPLARRGTLVETPEEADVAVLRLHAGWVERGEEGSFERHFHAGSLEFHDATKSHLREVSAKVPTIVDVYLERPALLGEILDDAAVLIGNFGADSEALARVLFGEASPQGSLPFEIPRSMDAVAASPVDVPNGTENPVFPAGHGLRLP